MKIEASLVRRASSKTARTTLRNPVWKNNKGKEKEKKKKKTISTPKNTKIKAIFKKARHGRSCLISALGRPRQKNHNKLKTSLD